MQLLVLLFLLSHVATVTAVDGCLSDRDKDHRARKNCTAAGYSDVPPGLEPSTKVLLFPKNQFSGLSWSSFTIFEDIYEIDLTGNQVPQVTPSDSPVLPSLSVLRLGSNRITSLSDNSFSACPGLTELYLAGNAMDSVSDGTFSGLSRLEILDLSSNHIKVLPGLMLHPLPAIETLYLEDNKIKVMPDEWFSQKPEVPYLYLSANPWACSCSLGYLRSYLDDYELNVYVRDGPLIKSDGESVVCDSPAWHKGKPVLSLEESDLCSPVTESGPTGDFYRPATDAATVPATTTTSPPPTTPPPTTSPPPTTPPPTTSPPPTTPPPTTSAPPTTPLPPTTPPPTTPPPTTTPPPPTTAPLTELVAAPAPAPATPASVELHTTVYHRVVTWSWHHVITRFTERFNDSRSQVRSEAPLVTAEGSTRPTRSAVIPSTESPARVPTKPAVTTKHAPSTAASTTPTMQDDVMTTTIHGRVLRDPGRERRRGRGDVRGAGVFCLWLFAACLLLCAAAATCILATLVNLINLYRKLYKPLSVTLARRRGGGALGMRLLTCSRREEREVAGGAEGVMALYRSVLFIQRDAEEAMEGEDGGKEGELEGEKERLLIPLEPAGGGGGAMRQEEGEKGEREERGVYRKTVYRLLSKEEEIEGWKEVMEECRVSPQDAERRGGRRDDGEESKGGGASKKRYSVILREEREEAGGGRGELEWVVGGWEVKKGGGGGGGGGGEEWEEPRSSWGEWLAHYLPSMPWGVATPPESDAAQ